MRTKFFINAIPACFAVIFLLSMAGCLKDIDSVPEPDHTTGILTALKVADDFTWRTSKTLRINLKLTDTLGSPVQSPISFYSEYPDGSLLLQGESRPNGIFTRKYTVASARNSITVVIPQQDPIILAFTDTEINGFPAFEVTGTIIVQNTGLKGLAAFDPSAYYPSQGQYGTICFEDNWPYKGDYDFNDVVIDYNVKAIFNDDDLVSNIQMRLFLRAAGASFDNGFGISFRQWWSNQGPFPDIASVTVNGQTVLPEAGTVYPSYILIPSTKQAMNVLNTIMSNPFVPPVEFNVEIVFQTPIDEWDLEFPLQNPFIFVNQERGREVHLPFDPPTALADATWFGKGWDNTDTDVLDPGNFKALGGYFTYMSKEWYPWAINVYFETGSDELFQYPVEKSDITQAYTSFQGWVENWDPWDWYLPQYRVLENIYTKMPPQYNQD